jgi:hypothetical protein
MAEVISLAQFTAKVIQLLLGREPSAEIAGANKARAGGA